MALELGRPFQSRAWQAGRFRIDLSRPRVMGIVNVTPDSFSDGGRHADVASALAHCEQLLKEGAHILDIGGESSRPGAAAVSVDDELARVLPVLKGALQLGCAISIDTTKPEVMRVTLDAGADIINDIAALSAPGALDVVSAHSTCGVCLMHMRGEPRSMQANTQYIDVMAEVRSFLFDRATALTQAGIARDRITLDPGIGFGKSVDQNFELLARQAELLELGYPLLIGWSRKSSLGAITGRPADQRMPASIAAALAAVQHGAHVVRVHDVAATVDALHVWRAVGLPASRTIPAG